MKKVFYPLITFLLCSLGFAAKANQDTTVVVSHQDVTIQTNPNVGYTLYPSWTKFPATGTQYRRVMLQLKFECAPGLKCGEWDYINNIFIGRKGGVNGDSLGYEIARYITPYGFYWSSASNWNHTWYYDVTDFAPLLHDSVQIIYQHTGYEANADRGWKINVKFICIEGTPVREPISVRKLWSGSFRMGDPTQPVEAHLPAIPDTLDALAKNVRIRLINTGHGNDSAGGCMEFCARYRKILWDNNLVNQKTIWRDDCGSNSVYPQAGTWIYDRGGWCPGSSVYYDDQDILGLTGGTIHTIDMDMEPYIAYKNFGNIYTTGYLIQYKGIADSVDATLENVMAPTTETEFGRYNPICNQPIVVIRNSGAKPLTSLAIKYGVEGGNQSTYNWTGNLKFMEMDTVILKAPVDWGTATFGNFIINTAAPNGTVDQYPNDDTFRTQFTLPQSLPNRFVVYFKSNSVASENYYYIKDLTNDVIVFQKNGFSNNTLYKDTITLNNGCYQFYFGCDGPTPNWGGPNKHGLEFWAFDQYVGTGTLQLRSTTSAAILKNITSATGGPYGTNGGDFGTFYKLNFTTSDNGLAVQNVNKADFVVETYPNPTTDVLNVDFSTNIASSKIELYDVQGKLLQTQISTEKAGIIQFNMQAYATGIYYVKFLSGENVTVRMVIKR